MIMDMNFVELEIWFKLVLFLSIYLDKTRSSLNECSHNLQQQPEPQTFTSK